jgi:RNA polymerase sigma-70 factor, ECF subfamily
MDGDVAELYAWFRRALGDDPQCADLVQDTLLATLERGDPTRLMAIAHERLVDHLVRDARRRGARTDAWLVHEDDPATIVMRNHDAQKLHAAIAGLSKRLREVLELFYFESLCSATIARRLGLPHATVRTRLHRARLSLRRSVDC